MDATSIMVELLDFQEGVLTGHADDVLDVLDSLDLVEFIKFIENKFDVRIGIEEVTVARFHDLASIAAFVAFKTKAAGAR